MVRLLVSPDGRAGFAQSEGDHLEVLGDAAAGQGALRCRIEGTLYPFEVCSEAFLVPGLLGMALRGEDPAEAEP